MNAVNDGSCDKPLGAKVYSLLNKSMLEEWCGKPHETNAGISMEDECCDKPHKTSVRTLLESTNQHSVTWRVADIAHGTP